MEGMKINPNLLKTLANKRISIDLGKFHQY